MTPRAGRPWPPSDVDGKTGFRETPCPEGRPIPDFPREHPDPSLLARRFADEAEVRSVMRGYLRFLAGADQVIDLGCGRGIFLDLLSDAGIPATGLEASDAAAEEARSRGHEVVVGDAVEHLGSFADSIPGIFCSHVVEHLPPGRVPDLFHAAAGALRAGGRMVVVTPNPKNLIVLTEVFWLDPTHVRPWPRPILEALAEATGLRVIESFDDLATVPRRPPLQRLLARIRSALSGADRSGPMDSVVVVERP